MSKANEKERPREIIEICQTLTAQRDDLARQLAATKAMLAEAREHIVILIPLAVIEERQGELDCVVASNEAKEADAFLSRIAAHDEPKGKSND